MLRFATSFPKLYIMEPPYLCYECGQVASHKKGCKHYEYSKEEVVKLLEKFAEFCGETLQSPNDIAAFEEWLENNL